MGVSRAMAPTDRPVCATLCSPMRHLKASLLAQGLCTLVSILQPFPDLFSAGGWGVSAVCVEAWGQAEMPHVSAIFFVLGSAMAIAEPHWWLQILRVILASFLCSLARNRDGFLLCQTLVLPCLPGCRHLGTLRWFPLSYLGPENFHI